jgi:hypothetical protein
MCEPLASPLAACIPFLNGSVMKRLTDTMMALAISGGLLVMEGCVVREGVVYQGPPVTVGGEVVVAEAPPAPLVETVTIAPDPALVWIGGVWIWSGFGWRWEAGHWARPPRPGAVWVPHRYEYRGGHHVWVRGGWR